MSKVKRVNRSAKTGQFVNKKEAAECPSTTVSETISPSIIYHDELIEMLEKVVKHGHRTFELQPEHQEWYKVSEDAEKLLEKVKK